MNAQNDIQNFIGIKIYKSQVLFKVLEEEQFDGYNRQLISYPGSEQDEIRAFLFIPKNIDIRGAILVHHQHNGERHLGKSEVSGLIGDPYQAFCPFLCSNGFICLAPDSICFEDRRKNKTGVEEDGENDVAQHYNEMCYRILQGESLMKKVIEDSSIAISLLQNLVKSDQPIGILGHSYGGNTVLFHSALDERIHFSCSSGALCSYKNKMQMGTGIEMAEVIPGFLKQFEIIDLLKCIYSRKLLVLSASDDKFSKDASDLIDELNSHPDFPDAPRNFTHKRYKGSHPLTQERFDLICEWFIKQMQ